MNNESGTLGGFAPGAYYKNCILCGKDYTGAKESYRCLDCAELSADVFENPHEIARAAFQAIPGYKTNPKERARAQGFILGAAHVLASESLLKGKYGAFVDWLCQRFVFETGFILDRDKIVELYLKEFEDL